MSIKQNFPSIRPSLLLDFASTKQLDPRITFTRASTATYWDGVTQAKAEENLLLRSQEFDNAAWARIGSVVAANSAVAPDGTSTADKLTEDSSTGQHRAIQGFNLPASVYTISAYLKAAERGFAFLMANTDQQAVLVNLSTGSASIAVGAPANVTSVDAGNGWWRVSFTFTGVNLSANYGVLASADGVWANRSYAGVAGSGMLVWGAQLEQRSSVTAYTPTTDQPITKYQPALQTAAANVARFDHNPVTGESLGLLIEEQRTNLLIYSEALDNGAWVKGNSAAQANMAVAPDGAISADYLRLDASTASHYILSSYAGVLSGNTYTGSIYAKAGVLTCVQITGTTNEFGASQFANFDLVNGVISSSQGGAASMTHVGNGWYRCAFSVACLASAQGRFAFVLIDHPGQSRLPSIAGDGFSGIYLWGAQLEAGAFPTSYIPTTSAQVTRAADAAVMTGTNFSSWYRQDEGTVYSEYSREYAGISVGYAITDGTAGNNIQSSPYYADTRFVIFGVGVSTTSLEVPSTNPRELRAAFAIRSGDSALALNNAAIVTGAPTVLPVASRLDIGHRLGLLQLNGHTKKLAYYPKRLSNTELRALTA